MPQRLVATTREEVDAFRIYTQLCAYIGVKHYRLCLFSTGLVATLYSLFIDYHFHFRQVNQQPEMCTLLYHMRSLLFFPLSKVEQFVIC